MCAACPSLFGSTVILGEAWAGDKSGTKYDCQGSNVSLPRGAGNEIGLVMTGGETVDRLVSRWVMIMLVSELSPLRLFAPPRWLLTLLVHAICFPFLLCRDTTLDAHNRSLTCTPAFRKLRLGNTPICSRRIDRVSIYGPTTYKINAFDQDIRPIRDTSRATHFLRSSELIISRCFSLKPFVTSSPASSNSS
jgi:hypothetical protein